MDVSKYADFVNAPIDCDDGWHGIIADMLCSLKYEMTNDVRIEITTIKEKFGVLNVYSHIIANDLVNDKVYHEICDKLQTIITEAEEKSTTTCERCGKDGSMTNKNGWYKTLCGDCAIETDSTKI